MPDQNAGIDHELRVCPMKILRLIQITGLILCLVPMFVLGHQYYSHMTAPQGQTARFVSVDGKVRNPAQGAPTFIESAKIMINGMLGKEEEPKSDLSALHTRTRLSQISYDERSMREMSFWMDFTSKLGFSGP
ncbi:hypothetical protein [Litoreibacter janthinus]|uniref:Uncharacterized protein n=1 Tax=Litoreibacter janthinus TaxID=670154 RepID=A0A1I6IEI1_9RHOB|nr:hypothetical protein [Litoreibacter janthinus]SFR65132.1 hypothetical protein SAMN04488002_3751 [Litoreibacter janthinus]